VRRKNFNLYHYKKREGSEWFCLSLREFVGNAENGSNVVESVSQTRSRETLKTAWKIQLIALVEIA